MQGDLLPFRKSQANRWNNSHPNIFYVRAIKINYRPKSVRYKYTYYYYYLLRWVVQSINYVPVLTGVGHYALMAVVCLSVSVVDRVNVFSSHLVSSHR